MTSTTVQTSKRGAFYALIAAATFALSACQNFPDAPARGGPQDSVWPYPEPPTQYPSGQPGGQAGGQAGQQQRPPQPQPDPRYEPSRPIGQPGPVQGPGQGPVPQDPAYPGSQSQEPVVYGPRSVDEASGPAARGLVQQALEHRRNGEPDRAAATLERAVRVEPRNGFLWLELADLKLDQGAPAEARALANRALDRTPNNPWVAAPAYRIIAGSHRAEGNRSAERNANTLAQVEEDRIRRAER